MIDLSDKYRKQNNGADSKGNQIKFLKDNIWYKLDGLGFEGLSETISANILSCSNCDTFVRYREEEIQYKNKVYKGCKSKNFLNDQNESLVTSARLSLQHFGKSIRDLLHFKTTKQRIAAFADRMSKATKLDEESIGRHLTQILELDAFILNNDRHFNNIAFIYNEKENLYSFPPIFDNGAAFMSYESYPDRRYVDTVDARPFSNSFEKQKQIAEELFGKQLQICLDDFTKIMPIKSFYDPLLRKKVAGIINEQANNYADIVSISNLGLLEKSFAEVMNALDRQIAKLEPFRPDASTSLRITQKHTAL